MSEQQFTEAIIDLIREGRRDQSTQSGYKISVKACKSIGLDAASRAEVLHYMGYVDEDGKPYPWVLLKKARGEKE